MRDSEVFASIQYHKLQRLPVFDTLTSQEFAKIYNGYGPDKWPSAMRAVISWIFGMFPEVSGEHDIGFFYSDGTRKGFEATIKRWKKNSSIMLNVRYPMSSPSLYIHRAVAWGKLYLARKAISGESAYKFYLQAALKRMADENRHLKT